MEFTEKDIARFWKKVDVQSRDKCWNWTAYCDTGGYGAFYLNGKREYSHVISLFLSCCPQPENKTCALHTCKQNRKCCNPSHLYLGNRQDNMDDKVNDETQARGETNGWAKLTDVQVLEIREKYIPIKYSQKKLADEYGVSQFTISYIINRKTWTHI